MTFACGQAARALAAAAAIFLLGPSLDARPQPRVVVFAAASLANVLDALSSAVTSATGVRLVTSYAATSALARQIEAGAPASIFIAADLDWMDYLDSRGLVERTSRVNLVGNSLVLIAPAGPRVLLRVAPAFPLKAALGDSRLAIADPSAVPAGRYAEAALRSLNVWVSVESQIAPTENVRAALVLVARGESPLGIVYATDARADSRVQVVDTFPATSHPPIVYPAALTTGAGPEARTVLTYLAGPAARAVFERHGFTRP